LLEKSWSAVDDMIKYNITPFQFEIYWSAFVAEKGDELKARFGAQDGDQELARFLIDECYKGRSAGGFLTKDDWFDFADVNLEQLKSNDQAN